MPCFIGFPSTGRVGGRPVVSSLSPRVEPFGVAMGVKRVPWFGDWRRLASRKSPEFPRRNAKTRWCEPAGLERNGHVAVTKSMEAPGIEPGSRGVFVTASTCVAVDLFLAVDPVPWFRRHRNAATRKSP
ncbi:MAG: hypothetical protein ACK5OC_00350, partial [Pirellula sp.]